MGGHDLDLGVRQVGFKPSLAVGNRAVVAQNVLHLREISTWLSEQRTVIDAGGLRDDVKS
jgi:hypothetical protein